MLINNWLPMSPLKGPPFPASLGIYWPWYSPSGEHEILPDETEYPGTEPPDTGTLLGFVSDASTGIPLIGAKVALGSQETKTGPQGYYSFESIEPRTYELVVLAQDYEITRRSVKIKLGENKLDLTITPLPPAPVDKLTIYAENMPHNLWSGSVTDIETQIKQSWGVQNIETRITLDPPTGDKILFECVAGYGQNSFGPYIFKLPSRTGVYVWDGESKKLGGISPIVPTDLAHTNNLQLVRGTVTSVSPALPSGISIEVTSSETIPGYFNAGVYFIGQVIGGPISSLRLKCISAGDDVEAFCSYQYISGLPAWSFSSVRFPRTYPDSYYEFSGEFNMLGSPTTGYRKLLTVTGNTAPFRIAIAAMMNASHPYYGVIEFFQSIEYLEGPVVDKNILTLPFSNIGKWMFFAHPDPSAELNDCYEFNNWSLITIFQS